MSNFTFTSNSITVSGKTYPAAYSITPSGAVMAFVTTPDTEEPQRVRFALDHPDHAAALAAAQAEKAAHEAEAAQAVQEVPTTDAAQAVQEAPTTDAAQAEQEAPTAQAEQEAPTAQAEPAPVPAKDFIGQTITGNGWRIFFDGEVGRTRVIFDAAPTDAARAALEKAGFYFSSVMNSYNKKLTHKAHRAAVALSGELGALYA